jgi:hypothetical protein
LINSILGANESKLKSKLINLVSKKEAKSSLLIDKLYLYLSCCYFMLGAFKECEECIHKCSIEDILKDKVRFHLMHKNGTDKGSDNRHQLLQDSLQDQLCSAAIHYNRSHFQEAIDIYKKILIENRHFLALNVYIALCYYRLDYYDVSQEVLALYLQHYPDSIMAINLKACNHYRLYNSKAAEVSSFDQSSSLLSHLNSFNFRLD